MTARSDSIPGLPSLTRGSARLPRLPGMVAREYAGARRPDPDLPRIEAAPKAWDTPPTEWGYSKAEWAIYWACLNIFKEGDRRFPFWGGRTWGHREPVYGSVGIVGFLPDFNFSAMDTTVNVNDGRSHRETEQLRARILAGMRPPITHVIIDAEDARANPTFHVEEALKGTTHSVFGRLI